MIPPRSAARDGAVELYCKVIDLVPCRSILKIVSMMSETSLKSAVSLRDEGARKENGRGLKGAFTRYVRSLERRGEPDAMALGEVWEALRAALVHELRKRSLWTRPPSYVGVYGWESWQTRGPGATEDPLDELLADCYSAIFVHRLPRLYAHLKMKPNIEGLVFLLIRNYLYDRQKRHDPLGFRVFEVLRLAVHEAVAGGDLCRLAGDGEIRGDTVLACSDAEAADRASDGAALRPLVERWNDELLPDLVTAVGPARQLLVARLRRRLHDLDVEGVRVFRFKDLTDAFKDDVRLRWAAVYDFEEGEKVLEDDNGFAAVTRLHQPDCRFEARESYEKLVSCVSNLLEELDEPDTTRHYLRTLWGFLRHYAGGDGPERLPSNRKLADLLRIPRERFPGLYETLGRLTRKCERNSCGQGTVLHGRERFNAKNSHGRPS